MRLSSRTIAAITLLIIFTGVTGACSSGTESPQGQPAAPPEAAKLAQDARKSLDSGNVQQAMEQFATAVALGANDVETHAGLGRAYTELGRFEEAIAELTIAVGLKPDDDLLLESRAIARIELFKKSGDAVLLAAAIADADAAAKQKPDRIGPIFARGEAYFLAKDYEKALADLQECVKRSDKFKRAWLLKGMTNAALGRQADATADFSKVITLDPSGGEAAQARSELAKLQ